MAIKLVFIFEIVTDLKVDVEGRAHTLMILPDTTPHPLPQLALLVMRRELGKIPVTPKLIVTYRLTGELA